MNYTYLGTRYSTDNATLIGKGCSMEDKASPEWWAAGLYRRPMKKDFFIAGEGNSMTVFKGEERIIPLTDKQAKIWASWFLDEKSDLTKLRK